MKKFVLILFAALCMATTVPAQEYGGIVRLDKTLHDFGVVSMKDGPVSCEFNLTNISQGPMTIYAVVSSCGCTNVEWTRETVAPGASGRITATYANDEGPYPFDKTLTVYVSDIKRPIVLHIKGVTSKKK